MAFYPCNMGSGIKSVLRVTQTEYDNLATKDGTTLYLITNVNKDMIIKMMQGEDRFDVDDANDYLFKYKNIFLPGGCTMSGGKYNYIGNYNLNTGIKPFSTDNNSRSFEIVMKLHPTFNCNPTPDSYNIFNVGGGSHYLRFSVDSSYNFITDEYNSSPYNVTFSDGDEIKVIFDKSISKRQIYINGSLADERGMPNLVDNTSEITIFGFTDYGYLRYMPGLIDEISFRFLD